MVLMIGFMLIGWDWSYWCENGGVYKVVEGIDGNIWWVMLVLKMNVVGLWDV